MTPHRILSVDDSEADQFFNELRIREAGPEIEIRLAYDGAEALEILREPGYRPDLVLLDINMPGMDGFEFLEAYAKEFEVEQSSVVVMLSTSIAERDREKASRHQAVKGYLTKPLPRGWQDEVRELLVAEG